VEIKQILAIMTVNVEEGREVHHGLVSIDGIVDINHPEKVFVKPHTYITAEEFREIRNTNDHVTALNRLNLAVEKLLQVLIETPQVTPRPRPEAPPLPPVSLKPYVNWVSTGCNHVWPDPDYKFGEMQFLDIKPAHFRVDLVTELNKRVRKHESFAAAVYKQYLPSDLESTTNDEMEELVNNRLNQLYQGLPALPPPTVKASVNWLGFDCTVFWPKSDYEFFSYDFNFINNPDLKAKLINELNWCIRQGLKFNRVAEELEPVRPKYQALPITEIENKLNELHQSL